MNDKPQVNDQHEEDYSSFLATGGVKLRSIIISGPVNEALSSSITKSLFSLSAEDPDAPIAMYLNTYGGTIYDMFAIYDVMKFIKTPIYTIGFGKVMSAGVLILAAGTPGHRYILPNTVVMTHKVRGGAVGTSDDMEATGNHVKVLQADYEKILMKHTKISPKQIKDFIGPSDVYLTTAQAKKFGIVDHISGVMPRIMQ